MSFERAEKQHIWDRALIAQWMRDGQTGVAIKIFMQRTKSGDIPPADALDGLLRVPLPVEYRMPARAFVSTHLTPISDYLWDDKCPIELLEKLRTSGLDRTDTSKERMQKYKAKQYEDRVNRAHMQSRQMTGDATTRLYDTSNWKQTKPSKARKR